MSFVMQIKIMSYNKTETLLYTDAHKMTPTITWENF